MTKTDAVGGAGGKVTIETNEPNSMRKIRLKYAPKDYKRGPGPTGQDRLQRSVNALLQKAQRLSRKENITDEERLWARRLMNALMAFNAAEYVNEQPRFDIEKLI